MFIRGPSVHRFICLSVHLSRVIFIRWIWPFFRVKVHQVISQSMVQWVMMKKSHLIYLAVLVSLALSVTFCLSFSLSLSLSLSLFFPFPHFNFQESDWIGFLPLFFLFQFSIGLPLITRPCIQQPLSRAVRQGQGQGHLLIKVYSKKSVSWTRKPRKMRLFA